MIDGRLETACAALQQGDYGSALYLLKQAAREYPVALRGTAATAQIEGVAFDLLEAMARRLGLHSALDRPDSRWAAEEKP